MGGSIAGWIWPTEGTGQIRVILQCATSVRHAKIRRFCACSGDEGTQ